MRWWASLLALVTLTAAVPPQNTMVTVANNAALRATSVAAAKTVLRAGFAVPGDGGAAVYTASPAACTAADDGAQVATTVGTGCWRADFSVTSATPLVWGAKGDGVNDDSAAVQAAINARANDILWLGDHLYRISAPLTSSKTIDIRGVRDGGLYDGSCHSGFIAAGAINLLSLSGPTGAVRNVCFNMGGPSSGTAVSVGSTSSWPMGQVVVEGNTILDPFDGIAVGGAPGQQTNGSKILHNMISRVKGTGVSVGRNSYGFANPGTTLSDNQVTCNPGGVVSPGSIGIAIYDGAVEFFGYDTGPYACDTGLAILPGTAGGNGQGVDLRGYGVIADSSSTYGLLINATTPLGSVIGVTFANWWVGAVNVNDHPIVIKNTGGGANRVHDISFTGGIINSQHSGDANSLISIENDVFNITLTGNSLLGGGVTGGTTLTQTGIRINTTGAGGLATITITGNIFGKSFNGGGLHSAVDMTGTTADTILINSNNMTYVDNPSVVAGACPTPYRCTATGNFPIDAIEYVITAAASIDVGWYREIAVTGASTTITNMLRPWAARELRLELANPQTFSNAGTGDTKICNNLSAPVGLVIANYSANNGRCWFVR